MKNTITQSLYLDLVKDDGCILGDIPEQFMTEEICIESVKETCGKTILMVPARFRTNRFYKEIVKDNGYLIDMVPNEEISQEMIIEAIKYDRSIIMDLPEDIVSKDTYRIALQDALNLI